MSAFCAGGPGCSRGSGAAAVRLARAGHVRGPAEPGAVIERKTVCRWTWTQQGRSAAVRPAHPGLRKVVCRWTWTQQRRRKCQARTSRACMRTSLAFSGLDSAKCSAALFAGGPGRSRGTGAAAVRLARPGCVRGPAESGPARCARAGLRGDCGPQRAVQAAGRGLPAARAAGIVQLRLQAGRREESPIAKSLPHHKAAETS